MNSTSVRGGEHGEETKAILAAILVLTLTLSSTALAGSGRNGIFNLGVINSVSGYVTTLTGSVAGRMLQVTNSNTATSAIAVGANNSSTTASTIRAQNTGGGPALEAVVPSGKSPMRVSAGAAKVANLTVDKLDNLDSTQLQRRVSGTCAVGSSIRAISTTGTVTCETKAGNADKLDGMDSTGFYAAGSKVADSTHADTADSATSATNATNAGHANTATSATNATNATNAANADKLDGMDSTAFMPFKTYYALKDTNGGGAANSTAYDTFSCDAGDVLLSGGYWGVDSGTQVQGSTGVTGGYNRYYLEWRNDGTADSVYMYVNCVDSAPYRASASSTTQVTQAADGPPR